MFFTCYRKQKFKDIDTHGDTSRTVMVIIYFLISVGFGWYWTGLRSPMNVCGKIRVDVVVQVGFIEVKVGRTSLLILPRMVNVVHG